MSKIDVELTSERVGFWSKNILRKHLSQCLIKVWKSKNESSWLNEQGKLVGLNVQLRSP